MEVKKSKTPKKEEKKKESQFLATIRYTNVLPDIPFDPKFLAYPLSKLRFVKYTTTSLEKNYKYLLHTEPDMGIPIDLIDPNAYKTPQGAD
jgi:RNA polymerase II-associated factor 1